MRNLKIHITLLFSLFAYCLLAQVHQQVAYPSEHLSKLVSAESPKKTADGPQGLMARTEAIYKTLYLCESKSIAPFLSGTIKWNDKENYTFSGESPSLANLFDDLIPYWADWKLYDLTYQASPNNVITVHGRYRVVYDDRAAEASFIHVWKWETGQVVEFQHLVGELLPKL